MPEHGSSALLYMMLLLSFSTFFVTHLYSVGGGVVVVSPGLGGSNVTQVS